jgi:hypothetical protein
VPSNRTHTSLEELLIRLIPRTPMDKVNLRMTLRRSRGRMNVMTSEVASELESFCNRKIGKVLVSEGYYLTLGNVAGEFVFAGIGETAQLNALNLSTDSRSEVGDLCVGLDEVREARVGIFAVFVVLERFEGRIDLVFVPCGEIVGILTSR